MGQNPLSEVSVPLRGLIMWKLKAKTNYPGYICFSPLTGINYVETVFNKQGAGIKVEFQSPYGD